MIVETVGVGQDEVEIVRVAHTTVGRLAPGLGDDIQAIKAGMLEIADIHVVNKCRPARRRPHRRRADIDADARRPAPAHGGWPIPVLRDHRAAAAKASTSCADRSATHRDVAASRPASSPAARSCAASPSAIRCDRRETSCVERLQAPDGDAAFARVRAAVARRELDPHSRRSLDLLTPRSP